MSEAKDAGKCENPAARRNQPGQSFCGLCPRTVLLSSHLPSFPTIPNKFFYRVKKTEKTHSLSDSASRAL